ncbi:Hsp20/alpha crystallin family protein [Bacillus horti]|uniref:HSP20 family protein n=1 Tax=Caldalkalibacillus horti TaxID=77523 RepID=A0ABT9W0K4_9BACI|nr:Hsp20/alpha crystallin family protein [Bacillus horti]MDQ0166806.1 HSP20 family protein [Bacillus horti]
MIKISELNPYRSNEDPFEQLLRSFHDLMESNWASPFGYQSFRSSIREDTNHYIVTAELPGVAKDDINLELEGHYLTIRAKTNEINELKDHNNYLIGSSRRTGEFVRSFFLGNADVNSIQAKLENGLLHVWIPKLPDNHHSRKQIPID